jgi:hypothetical protein
VFEKAYAAQEERVRIALKGRPLYEFGKYNLIVAQVNELHACIIEAAKRDPALNLADADAATVRAIDRLCDLEFDAAAASAEEAERLLLAAKRQ